MNKNLKSGVRYINYGLNLDWYIYNEYKYDNNVVYGVKLVELMI